MTREEMIDAAVRPFLETVLETSEAFRRAGISGGPGGWEADIEMHTLAFSDNIRREFARMVGGNVVKLRTK